jgi:hypothetical protein
MRFDKPNMTLTPLELGSQPPASSGSEQKKTPTEKGETPHRVDAVVLLKILFSPGSSTLSGKSGTESISNGSEIKTFHFIASINTAYEPDKAEVQSCWLRCNVMFLDNFEISFLRFSPLPDSCTAA